MLDEAVILLAHLEGVGPVQVVEVVDRLQEARACWTLHRALQQTHRVVRAVALWRDVAVVRAFPRVVEEQPLGAMAARHFVRSL